MKPITLILCVVLVASCQSKKEEKPSQKVVAAKPVPPPVLKVADDGKPIRYPEPLPDSVKARKFQDGYDSINSLIFAVLDALEKKDTTRLVRAMISQKEFSNWLWWEFPASIPENAPLDFAWDNLARKADRGLRWLLSDYGGQKLRYVSHRFEEGEDKYQTFKVHSKTRVVVKDSLGNEHTLTQIGSVVEMNGSFKLMSYRDRD
ncbi:MAG: hypothetical protein NZM06_02295 [Chloroherpetonaceae bacterium]|nr:hypothetical protein [Chloroherpetonaceae bacterium]MDW8436542.1 hypothetical protein [Chloroherpetonaceae bacterium]